MRRHIERRVQDAGEQLALRPHGVVGDALPVDVRLREPQTGEAQRRRHLATVGQSDDDRGGGMVGQVGAGLTGADGSENSLRSWLPPPTHSAAAQLDCCGAMVKSCGAENGLGSGTALPHHRTAQL